MAEHIGVEVGVVSSVEEEGTAACRRESQGITPRLRVRRCGERIPCRIIQKTEVVLEIAQLVSREDELPASISER